MLSAHMWGMDQLLADLRHLVAHHAATADPDFSGLIGSLNEAIEKAETAPATYEYRHHLGWDNTWMELDESHITVVLENRHTVQRRRISAGDWETVTEAPHVSD